MPKLIKVDEETGFRVGTTSLMIAKELIKGGKSRVEINARINKRLNGQKTRTGNPPNIPVLVSNTIRALEKRGYKVDSHFQLVPRPKRSRKKVAA